MEDFDATEEVHTAIEKFIALHGYYPESVRISEALHAWLADIIAERSQLTGIQTQPGFYRSSDSDDVVRLVVDPNIDDYEVIAE